MRRNRKNSIKKERIIMLASSAFVLAALTMTGVYMKEQNMESKDDGYTLDFTTLENSVEDKYEEIAKNIPVQEQTPKRAQQELIEDDLDYMPIEVGSGDIEIPGLTNGKEADLEETDTTGEDAEAQEDETAAAENVIVEQSLSFSETEGLLRPVSGEVLIPYSMDSSVYFATLDQYKYNSAVIMKAEEGAQVSASAHGRVVNIYEDARIGKAVDLDLGNGYQATYGQLKDIAVSLNSYVAAGDLIGSVAAPTKYFSVEGSNLYFQLTKDGEAVNPEVLFQ